MSTLQNDLLSSIRKLKFSKESKKSPIIETRDITAFHISVEKEVSSLSEKMTGFDAKNAMIQALQERMVEIVKMRSNHNTLSKRDQGKQYFTNIITAIKFEIIGLYETIEEE